VKALGRARAAAYREGEFVGQENFMAADDILALGVAAARVRARVLDLCCGVGGRETSSRAGRRAACSASIEASAPPRARGGAAARARVAVRRRGGGAPAVRRPFDAVLLVERCSPSRTGPVSWPESALLRAGVGLG
jgi:hypothetical protein